MVILRWAVHDTIRRRVAWYIIFNFGFTFITYTTAFLIKNIFIFYLASPLYIYLVYRVYDAMVSVTVFWKIVQWIILAYCIFVGVDMIWLENIRTNFPVNIYPVEKAIIVIMAYYFLYRFSKAGSTDYSAFWIGLAIGINALFSFIHLIFASDFDHPSLLAEKNTISYFVWFGIGPMISLISYSFVSYGLWIAKPKLPNEPILTNLTETR
ncbi:MULTISPECIES: hypothetical protein [unclassified Spirosoma]|uniref:hypothetical protein n=1 Tax=unclassified Spirosoma TaxID=2621999 RepID=UPI001AD20C70|nr:MULTISPECIES: hypothetical protein [unclassified Spirosoma]MBN8820495.1 hypothetical protein [Spirosoma sp.]